MKILCSIVAILFSLTVSAQSLSNNSSECFSVSPTAASNNLLFNWDAGENTNATYFVEGSKDGKTFKTIGIVWGTTVEMNNLCQFKEKKNRIGKKYKYYRVSLESLPAAKEN